MKERDAYMEGYTAIEHKQENPYPVGSHLFLLWEQGAKHSVKDKWMQRYIAILLYPVEYVCIMLYKASAQIKMWLCL